MRNPQRAPAAPHLEGWLPFSGGSSKTDQIRAETERIKDALTNFRQEYDARLEKMAAKYEELLHSFEERMDTALDRATGQASAAQNLCRSCKEDVRTLSDRLTEALAKHRDMAAEMSKLYSSINALRDDNKQQRDNLKDLVSILIQHDRELQPILDRFSSSQPADSFYDDNPRL